MTNKYKEEISKYKISNKSKDKLLRKIENQKVKKFRLAYSIIIIMLICTISVGIAYAKDIKKIIESWGKTNVTFYEKEGKKTDINLNSIAPIVTKLDNYTFDEETYQKILEYNKNNKHNYEFISNFTPESLSGIIYFNNQKIEDIENKLGIELLGIKGLNYEYYYNEITNERKIGGLLIRSEDYVLSCTKTNGECNKTRPGYKGFNITIKLTTSNTQKDYSDNEIDYSYDFKEVEYNPTPKKFKNIGDFKVNGISYQIPIVENNREIKEFTTEMFFNHNDIRYEIRATCLTQEEIIDILTSILK